MTDDDQLDTIRSIMKDVRTCMLVTASDDGALHSCPMTTQEAEFDGDVWFLVAASSEAVRNLRDRPGVNVSWSGTTSWLSLAGTATLVEDQERKKDLWNTFVEAWFPGGVDDPSVVVVKVEGESAHYWDSPGRVTMMASMLKARVTGDTPEAGESHAVDLPAQA